MRIVYENFVWEFCQGFEYISNENNERVSRLVLKMWCVIIGWCVWNI